MSRTRFLLALVLAIFILLFSAYLVYHFFLQSKDVEKEDTPPEIESFQSISVNVPPIVIPLLGGEESQKVSVFLGIDVVSEEAKILLNRSMPLIVDIVFTSLTSFFSFYLETHKTVPPQVIIDRVIGTLQANLLSLGLDPQIIKGVFIVHFKIEPVV